MTCLTTPPIFPLLLPNQPIYRTHFLPWSLLHPHHFPHPPLLPLLRIVHQTLPLSPNLPNNPLLHPQSFHLSHNPILQSWKREQAHDQNTWMTMCVTTLALPSSILVRIISHFKTSQRIPLPPRIPLPIPKLPRRPTSRKPCTKN